MEVGFVTLFLFLMNCIIFNRLAKFEKLGKSKNVYIYTNFSTLVPILK